MVKRKPIPPNINKEDYNNGGLHEYDPYIINEYGRIIIDEDWFFSLTDFCRKLIVKKLDVEFKLDKVKVPHAYLEDPPIEKPLTKIFQAYLDCFDYNIWYNDNIPNGPEGVQMIHIPQPIKRILKDAHYGNKQNFSNLWVFKKKIDRKLKRGQKYFIRLSSTSGKNEIRVEPMENSDQIINHLIKNKLFVHQEFMRLKDTYLIIIPWNDKIDPRYEFRIFVKGRKLTGVSQQFWWMLFNYTQDELQHLRSAFKKIDFINHVPYNSFVADIYYDPKSRRCKLIELNPFGAHCGAGSSLFNWVKDYKILHGLRPKRKPEFRYLSVINY